MTSPRHRAVSPAIDAARIAFGKALRAWRVSAGLSLRDLAGLCRVSAVAVTKWERGETTPTEQHRHTLERAGFYSTPDVSGDTTRSTR